MDQNPPVPGPERRGLRIGAIAGVPIYLSPTWLIIAAVIILVYRPMLAERIPGLSAAGAYLTAAAFVVLLFGSVLLHELGHAVTALRLGVGVRAMTLWMLGGFTEMESEPRTPAGEFAVAVAGPAVSAVLGLAGLAGLLALEPGGVSQELAIQVMFSNLSVAVFNLLPGLPLDGGSLVRAAVWRIAGDRAKGTIIAGWAGRVVAVAVLALGLGLAVLDSSALPGLLLTFGVGIFLWIGAGQSIRAARFTARMPHLVARDLARPTLTVPSDLPLAEALRRAIEAGARGLIVVDADGAATGVVAEHEVAATPEARRPWVAVAAVARTLEPGMIISADLAGEALLRAMAACPGAEYVVNDGDRILGVLVAGDVTHTLDPKGTTR